MTALLLTMPRAAPSPVPKRRPLLETAEEPEETELQEHDIKGSTFQRRISLPLDEDTQQTDLFWRQLCHS